MNRTCLPFPDHTVSLLCWKAASLSLFNNFQNLYFALRVVFWILIVMLGFHLMTNHKHKIKSKQVKKQNYAILSFDIHVIKKIILIIKPIAFFINAVNSSHHKNNLFWNFNLYTMQTHLNWTLYNCFLVTPLGQ